MKGVWLVIERCVHGQPTQTDHKHGTVIANLAMVPVVGEITDKYSNIYGESVRWVVESVIQVCDETTADSTDLELLTISFTTDFQYSEEGGVLSILDQAPVN